MTSELDHRRSEITLADLHQAIERLAIDQTTVARAVMRLVAEDTPLRKEDRDQIYRQMDEIRDGLSELASKFLDIPYGR